MLIALIKAVILGIVEGVTEFLPISSTGHLIIINHWLSFGESFTKVFDVVIQLGAILAAVIYFWPKIWPWAKGASQETDGVEHRERTLKLWSKIIVAVIPALILGALLGNYIETKLFNPTIVAIALIIGGLVLIFVEKGKTNEGREVHDTGYGTALGIGLFQCLALIPGTSRSAATIVGALLLGLSRQAAVEFSFFVAIPTMFAASVYTLYKHSAAISGSEYVILALGFVVACLTALWAIKFFVSYITRKNFVGFGYYRIVLGILVLVMFFA